MFAVHPKPMDLPSSWSAERLLLVTGIPVLLIPDGWTGATIGDDPLIAWNRRREARRAVNDALPFIKMAAKVTILKIGRESCRARVGTEVEILVAAVTIKKNKN